ncbi:ABC transporter ATP-binding protein [Streptomyces tendae]|uniref:ABC transporter ATP-binding protein n=1 Tax=Streptomyces tendae TaxID=1932 RepID=UPI00340CA112
MVLSIPLAGAIAGTGLAQRWLIDDSPTVSTVPIIGALALGVAAHAASVVLGRYRANLIQLLNERVVMTLTQEVLTEQSEVPTVEHLDDARYRDRLSQVLRGVHGLASFCWILTETATALISLALTLWLLAEVDPLLLLLAACAVPPFWLSQVASRTLRRTLDAQAERERLEQDLHELCLQPQAATELRVSGSGPEVSRRAASLWREQTARLSRARLLGVGLQSVGWLIFVVGVVGAVALVIRLVHEGRTTAGGVVMVLTLTSQLRQQIALTLSSIRRVDETGRVADHYQWLRRYAAEHHGVEKCCGPPTALIRGITLSRVSYRYDDEAEPVLRDVTIELPAGSVIGLVGVNGAGKSTLVKLLTGLQKPTQGQILIDGVPLSSIRPSAWAARCAGVFQDFVKPQARLAEVVGMGDLPRLTDRPAIRRAIEAAGASELVERLEQGLDTQLGSVFGGRDLSHGQWQRLALARGLLRRSPLLVILDEPTSGLDPQAEDDLFTRMAAQARAAAGPGSSAVTVLVSHRFSTVKTADCIVVLSGGHAVEQGTHEGLMTMDGVYAEMFRAQARGYGLV